LYNLGGQSLWTDELLSWWAFISTPGAPYWKKFLYDVHAPLYHFVLHFWSMISMREFWLRLPSAVAGVVSVFLLYRWTKNFLEERISLLAAALLAVNPLHLYYSQELRFYSFLVLFTITTLICFEKFFKSPNYKNTLVLAIAMAAMCLSHFSGLFIVASLFIVVAVGIRSRPGQFVKFILAVIILVVIISPWIYREVLFLRGVSEAIGFSVPREVRFREELAFTPWAYPYSFYAFSTGYSFGGFVPAFFLGLARLSKYRRFTLFASMLFIPVAVLTLLALLNIKVFNVRYLLCTLPAFIATLSVGLPKRPVLKYSVGILVFSVMLISDFNYHFVPRYSRDDVKGASRIIDEKGMTGDVVLILTVGDVFRFYYRGDLPIKLLYPKSAGADNIKSRITLLKEEYRRAWYIRCRNWDWDPDDVILESLMERFRLERSWSLPGINLYLFTLQQVSPHSKLQPINY